MSRFLLKVALVAVASSMVGYLMILLNLHGSVAGYWLAIALVPGVWIGKQFDSSSGSIFWSLAGAIQVAYWAIILVVRK